MTVAWFISQTHGDQRVSTLRLPANQMDSACLLHTIRKRKGTIQRQHTGSKAPCLIEKAIHLYSSSINEGYQTAGGMWRQQNCADRWRLWWRLQVGWKGARAQFDPRVVMRDGLMNVEKLPCKHMKIDGQGYLKGFIRALAEDWHTHTQITGQAAGAICQTHERRAVSV